LDLLVCLDLFVNATGREADLLLPTTCWLERWDMAMTTALLQQGSFIPYAAPVRPAPGAARSEVRILADMSLAVGRPLFGSRLLAWLWGALPWDAMLTVGADLLLWPARLLYHGARGIPAPRPRPGRYLGYGPNTPGRRVRFWHTDLTGETVRLADYATTLEVRRPPSCADGLASPTLASSWFTLMSRRRQLGHNSWLHSAGRDGKTETAAWFAPLDLLALGLPEGGEVRLQTASATLCLPAVPRAEVARGTVVVPHGLPEANVNALIPSGLAMLEPVSGQHHMTGIPVRVTPVR
jgi:formate dehydrogenase